MDGTEWHDLPAQNCCINCRVIFDYVQKRRPAESTHLFEDLPEPFNNLSDPKSFLTDDNNWVPSAVVVSLFENARKILEDPEAAFKIGFESVTERKLGYITRFFISTFFTVAGIVRRIDRINAKFNTTNRKESLARGPGRLDVRLHWNPNGELSRDVCAYNRGIFAAVPTLFGLKPTAIEETSCFFDGDPFCEYHCRWEVRASAIRWILESLATRKRHLMSALDEIENDKRLLTAKYHEVNQLNVELQDKVVKLEAINEASRILVSQKETGSFLDMTMAILVRILRFDRAILMMLDGDRKRLEYLHSIGGDPEKMAELRGYVIPLTRQHNLMVQVVRSAKPILVEDIAGQELNPENAIIRRFKPHSFCVCPLVAADNQVVGVLGADRKTYKIPITQTDVDYLSIFANNIAVSLQRARLDDELKMSYLSSVRALVTALEEKDSYTKGHSERVASLAALIGREMGFADEDVEYLRIGGYLHDIGKIGVPESIIKNPKALTRSEYRLVQEHTVKGVEILEPISFLKDHIHLIKHHHEHFDGRGYPDGLSGSRIPKGAQIMAVADAYDAMTSSRPYRKGLPPGQAYKRIVKESGKQFAPDVVEAFQKVYRTQLDRSSRTAIPRN
jgi:putative nucleotidyltransferase with HDIG domain